MQDRDEALLHWFLTQWYSDDELDEIYDSDQKAEDVAAELATKDLAFFCFYYLPHYFNQQPAEAHWSVFADIRFALGSANSNIIAETLPRGFAKSTIICVATTLWAFIGTDAPGVMGKARTPRKHYVILIKNTLDQAKEELRAVRRELETNEKLRRDFGDLVGAPWGRSEIVTANGCKMDALGAEQRIRGRRHGPYRPDMVIADDLEDDQSVLSPTQRMKIKMWWEKAVKKAGDPNSCDFFCLGTLLHSDCFQAYILGSPGVRARTYKALIQDAHDQTAWDEWEDLLLNIEDPDRENTALNFYADNKERMEKGAVVSWPARFPYYTLRLMKIGEKARVHGKRINAFASEMQNEPISDDERLFKKIQYYYYERRHGIVHLTPYKAGESVSITACRLYGACDPSLGESHQGDYSALIDILVSPNGRMFVVHAGIERRHPDRIIDAIGRRAEYWAGLGKTYQGYAIETNQFQKLFASKAGQDLLARGIRLPIMEVNSQSKKTARIDSLQPDITNGYILFYLEPSRNETPEEQHTIWQQLYDYPLGDFVDGPDALEMVRTIAAVHGGSGRRSTPERQFMEDPFSMGADAIASPAF